MSAFASFVVVVVILLSTTSRCVAAFGGRWLPHFARQHCVSLTDRTRRRTQRHNRRWNLVAFPSDIGDLYPSDGRPNAHHQPWESRPPQSVATATKSALDLPNDFNMAVQRLTADLAESIRVGNPDNAFTAIQGLFQLLRDTTSTSDDDETTLRWSAAVDASIQNYLVVALASTDRSTLLTGVRVLHMVLSSSSTATSSSINNKNINMNGIHPRYQSIPGTTIVSAISALSKLDKKTRHPNNNDNNVVDRMHNTITSCMFASQFCPLNESYRLLQRLITGMGVREYRNTNSKSKRGRQQTKLQEREFVNVLHGFCTAGDMVMAHRIVAMQERCLHAPPVSLASYSVLIKGYGHQQDLDSVERILERAVANGIQADVIMLNILIDAYINCNEMSKAETVFVAMKRGDTWGGSPTPPHLPNRRTYNTILKGYAKLGALSRAQKLSTEMKRLKLWDSVSTNTLVHAAVTAGDWAFAEHVLTTQTFVRESRKDSARRQQQHPNVQAYTELLDGYIKSDQLDRALAVMQTMQRRRVEPNEVTYTCLMSGLGRLQKVKLARKTLAFMEESTGIRPTTKMYNALISGLVHCKTSSLELDECVDEGMKVLRDMIQAGVQPNSVTVSVLVEALGRCRIPRVTEAKLLVEKIERKQLISEGNTKVATALLRTYGKAGDIQGVIKSFHSLKTPDTVAVNAFMDGCCRCHREKLAWGANERYFRKSTALSPDVITYSILLGALTKLSSTDARKKARDMYQEMRMSRRILPDNGLVDLILKYMIRIGASQSLSKRDVQWLLTVLKDAEQLEWSDDQLERRKRAVRTFLSENVRDVWRTDDPNLLSAVDDGDDNLFQRKGWNKVDSGFRLWGGNAMASTKEQNNIDVAAEKCKFLESHGWNDMKSGFRLF